MPRYVAANRARSTLAAALTASAGDVTLQIDPADVDLFPAVNDLGATSDEYTMLTLVDAAKHYENVKVTRRDDGSSSFTIERGQEGSEIRAWQIGDSVTLRLTAGVMTDLFDAGYRCQVSDTQPTNPTEGAFWFDSDTGQLWIWFVSETGGQWVAPGAVQLIGDGSITSAKLDQSGIALPDGSTAVTQAVDDNSTLLATTEWVNLFVSDSAAVDASTTAKGIVELATSTETITGTDATRAVTPAGLAAKVASTTEKGIAELATNAETQAGTDATRVLTPAAFAASSHGYGQTWQSPSRVAETIYQNLTGRPIQVCIGWGGGNDSLAEILVDDVTPPTFVLATYNSNGFGDTTLHVTFTVPNNHYYKLDNSTDGGDPVTIYSWRELR